ncbi:hypothetical protein R3W88_024181 [Solanum pinnatisectum]|uniref:Uncharacterized protein n=1 Tax=Solanum pinnatisectum TaxID=50273 RepID=A0AAV9M0I5_9SOLN|nr:hypothetical protein R3W88_024181 [Solanum pinnatisectum]
MLPSYLLNNGFLEKPKRTNWSELNAYKDKETGTLLEPQHPFNVEFAEDIMQQRSDNFIYAIDMQHCCGDMASTRSMLDTSAKMMIHQNLKGQSTPPFEEDLVHIEY